MPAFTSLRLAVLPAALAFATAAVAQDDAPPEVDHLATLKGCRTVADPSARLACFDAAAAQMVAATDAGDLRFVDREDVRQTRRRLFGFSLPDLGIFGGDDDDDEDQEDELDMLESTITRVRHLSSNSFTFVIADHEAVWQVNEAPSRLIRPEPGDKVVFKKAALGSYFIRINGQIGVKGRRIQ